MAQCHEPVEQFVLERLELRDLSGDRSVLLCHGIGMPLGFTMLVFGERGLGDECPESGLVGFGSHLFELFLTDPSLGAQFAQALTGIGKPSLDSGPGHGRSLEGGALGVVRR